MRSFTSGPREGDGRARRLAERGGFLAPLYPLREPSANNFYSITGWLGDEHVRIVCTNAATATVTRLGRRDGATVMPAGTAFVADAALMDPYRNATYVLFVGTNDGNGYADQYLRLYKAATDALPSGRFIVASSHQIADAAVIAKYRDAFGDHHLDMRKAMDDEGLATAVSLGLLTPEEAGGTTWRDALVAAYDADGDRDGVHFNEKGYAVVAEFIRRKLVSLGYVKIASEPPSDAFDWLETDGNGYVRTAYRPKTAKTRMEMRVRFLDEGRSHGLAIANPGTAGKTGEGVEWGCVRFGPGIAP